MRKTMLTALVAALLVPLCATAATTVVIPGNANIFGAGLSAPPSSPDNAWNRLHADQSGPGILPTGVTFSPDPYLVLQFAGITGGVGYNANPAVRGGEGFSNQWYGTNLVSTNVTSTAHLSGIMMHNRVMFLVGVFLGPGLPAAPPAALDFTNTYDRVNFNPGIGQTFFIGDGFTNAGLRQNFYVPTGANRLYLGFADSWIFNGSASWYTDNHGQLTATFDIVPTPDPATVWLVALPIAGLWYRARRRRA